jgi:hypothetical protein
LVARMEPPGPGGACHRAGQRPDPVGRPDDKLNVIRDGLTRITLRSIRAAGWNRHEFCPLTQCPHSILSDTG